MTTRPLLLANLRTYRSDFDEEQTFVARFLALLEHPHAFQRTHLPGHITGSAWIVSESREEVLLTHHAKLNRWLQPGGHADGDENIVQVASREAIEETGLSSLRLANDHIFDIDIHVIPARKEMPEHLHYDIRFLFEADRNEALNLTDESHDLAWVSLVALPNLTGDNASILRMVEKLR